MYRQEYTIQNLAAVEQFKTEYDDVSKPRDGNNLVALLMIIAHQTIDELKGKSASSLLKRSRSTPIPTQSQHNNT